RLGVILTSILVVMALVSILFVLRLSRRLERRTRGLAASEARERFLSEGARVLASSIDYEETLRATADLAVPTFADICLIDVVQEDGELRRIASTSADPAIDRQRSEERRVGKECRSRRSPRRLTQEGPDQRRA